jgi:hypothetical protein
MMPPVWMEMRLLQCAILRAASLLVPGRERAEWLREWRSELWHARDGVVCSERELTRFCLGSFQDALCLRQIAWQGRSPLQLFRGSAMECLLALAAVLGLSYGLSLVLPGVRAARDVSRYRVNPGLILIQDAAANDDSAATIPIEEYRRWKARRQRFFDGFAFYRVKSEAAMDTERWNVAHASLNLFWMLGLPVRFSIVDGETPGVVLSDAVWKRDFGGNPQIAENVVRVGGREARVLGVAPEGAWRLPGNVDAWLLEPDTENAGMGYVVAHLTALGAREMTSTQVQITQFNTDDGDVGLSGVSFAERMEGPWALYQFTIFLAFLALPAITSVSLGEYSFSEHRPSWTRTVRRWAFLVAKIALLLPSVYFASLDVAYWNTTSYSIAAEYAQLVSSFSLCLFGLRWALLDQRQRCPVCLKRVTNPARVGMAGRTFLAWNGTELICTSGHTLLHVPGLPTSWFGTQRWLYLDTSWRVLFAGPGVGG